MKKEKKTRTLVLSNKIYTIDEILTNDYNIEKKREGEDWIEYLDIVASFDIETSSFIDFKGEKKACMYIWMLGIEGKVTIGRTWQEFIECINKIKEHYKLNEYRRLLIYVHNLSYEFQWICKKFNWLSVFAREERKPMKAVTDIGIEFRCSYILSGCSLAKVGKDLQKYKVSKLVGNLDYTKTRTSTTPLTQEELDYCINDVLVVMAYIKEQMEYYGKLTRLPLTNTGRVRKLCKNNCYSKENRDRYSRLMKSLTLEAEEYKYLKRCFQGGFTHANFLYSEDNMTNVKSFDFTSSYPTVMISERYPMSKGEIVKDITIEEIESNSNVYCYVFNVRFTNIRQKLTQENYISKSKCWELSKPVENNGRIMRADLLTTTITEVDYSIIKDFYEWDTIEIGRCYRYRKAYLPTPLVETIISLYEDKTTLKDVEGKELDYMLKKGMLNSTYGMSCMDVAADEISYLTNWDTKKADLQKCIDNYNNDNSRFLFYGWAVYITAYARRNLFYGIKECGDDYIYSDTDSIKILNYESHLDFINRYNEWITARLDNACKFHKIDPERLRPRTVKGEVKQLGIWDDDGYFERFKTLGAKRYLVEKQGNIKATVAGINKSKLANYLTMQEDAFDYFSDGMTVPSDYSGKITCKYIDEETEGYIEDFMGNIGYYKEDSSIYMSVSDYKLGISESYRVILNSKLDIKYA